MHLIRITQNTEPIIQKDIMENLKRTEVKSQEKTMENLKINISLITKTKETKAEEITIPIKIMTIQKGIVTN